MHKNIKSKNMTAIVMAAAFMLGTAGCAENQIPYLTDRQADMIEEYVAVTVMRYEANHKSRLVELSETDFQQPADPAATITPVSPELPGQEDSMGGTSDTNVSEPVVKSYTMEEVLELPDGVTIVYTGQKFCSQYPDSGEIDGFVLPASEGKKLMVLGFVMFNTSEQERMVDLLSSNAIYGFTINGDYTRRALKSMLPEDLSYYKGDIPAGGSVEQVLILEVDETMDENVSSLIFNIKNDSKAFTIPLL